jgi:hypothetical protein
MRLVYVFGADSNHWTQPSWLNLKTEREGRLRNVFKEQKKDDGYYSEF